MTFRVFIDGEAGTTGQRLKTLLVPFQQAGQIDILSVPKEHRKDIGARRDFMAQADLTVLCLPDDAAKESVNAASEGVRILDASSAHRTADGWIYGFPELNSEQPSKIAQAHRVSNPGCFATGAIALLRPLSDAGILQEKSDIVILGVSGYSGGGNALIEKYESSSGAGVDNSWRIYSLQRQHKHAEEIATHGGFTRTPLFIPQTVALFQGMGVTIPFRRTALKGADISEIHHVFKRSYEGSNSVVKVASLKASLALNELNMEMYANLDRDKGEVDNDLHIYVTGWDKDKDGEVRLTAMLDNLGKGAASQAVQNIRLMLGF